MVLFQWARFGSRSEGYQSFFQKYKKDSSNNTSVQIKKKQLTEESDYIKCLFRNKYFISELTHSASKDISHVLSIVSDIGIHAWTHSVYSRHNTFINLTDIVVHSCHMFFFCLFVIKNSLLQMQLITSILTVIMIAFYCFSVFLACFLVMMLLNLMKINP